MRPDRTEAGLWLNADRLGEHSQLRVELLDLGFHPIPGYSGEDCVLVAESGFRQRVSWKQGDIIGHFDHPVRVRISWEGIRPEDAQLWAAYVA